MDRMINAHLVWSLESQDLLSQKQCGFRTNHSTLDHLVRFETFIRNAFVNEEHVLAIFFDLDHDVDARHSGRPLGYWFLCLVRASCLNVHSRLEKAPLCQNCTNRRWRFYKDASCLQPFSAWDDCGCRRFCSMYAGQVFKQSGKSYASVR